MALNTYYAVENLQEAFRMRLYPSITIWNRLEGRPRAEDFKRALRAEVRDALWMLTRQWQMGEFMGDDAGSPVVSKILAQTHTLNKYQADQHEGQPFPEDLPLEAIVEQKKLPFREGNQIISMDIRLMMGRHWLKMMQEAGISKQEFITQYPFEPGDPNDPDQAKIFSRKDTWQAFAAYKGRAMDGYRLYEHLTADAGNHAYDPFDEAPPGSQKTTIENLEEPFIEWFRSFFLQPRKEDNDAWLPSHLEYQFNCSGIEEGREKIYAAREYYHGHLDWYNLDINPDENTLGETGESNPEPKEPLFEEFIPTPISFGGMPNTRWWALEDATTNFGDIHPDTTDLNKLLVMEFGLIYANDWFLFPLILPAGSFAKVKGLTVTNVFGERTWIEPAGEGPDDDWQRWSMFTTSIMGSDSGESDKSIIFLPTTGKIMEGAPVEEVNLIRDEVANMVWGVEKIVPLPHGESIQGREAGLDLRNYLQKLKDESSGSPSPPETLENNASIRYRLMNTVPENWIPFIPVHTDSSKRQIKLQRASMPRYLENDTEAPLPVKPRTSLLRYGLESVSPYYIYEEEVPRAGTVVKQSYQRTRWYNGKTYHWFGIRKQTGRGEGSSGLAFDRIIEKKKG